MSHGLQILVAMTGKTVFHCLENKPSNFLSYYLKQEPRGVSTFTTIETYSILITMAFQYR